MIKPSKILAYRQQLWCTIANTPSSLSVADARHGAPVVHAAFIIITDVLQSAMVKLLRLVVDRGGLPDTSCYVPVQSSGDFLRLKANMSFTKGGRRATSIGVPYCCATSLCWLICRIRPLIGRACREWKIDSISDAWNWRSLWCMNRASIFVLCMRAFIHQCICASRYCMSLVVCAALRAFRRAFMMLLHQDKQKSKIRNETGCCCSLSESECIWCLFSRKVLIKHLGI